VPNQPELLDAKMIGEFYDICRNSERVITGFRTRAIAEASQIGRDDAVVFR
jgi:hypothetical protein